MKLLLSSAVLFIICACQGTANPVLVSSSDSKVDIVISDDSSVSCPPGYSQPANSNWDKCYKVNTSFKTRKDAAVQCKRDNGTLSSVPNAFTNSYLYSLASQSAASSLWLGIQCFSTDPSSCVNVDGTSLNYTNFYSGQPSLIDICVYMSTIGRDGQKWSTFDCEQNFQFACEVNSIAKMATTTTVGPSTILTTVMTMNTTSGLQSNCPTGYNEFNGTCYSIIFQQWLSYDGFKEQCQQIPGGDIVSIPTQEVNDFLTTMPTNCPHGFFIQIGLKCPIVRFAGDISTCVWDDGTPFGYNGFKTGEPLTSSACTEMQLGVWNNEFLCSQLSSCGACQAPLLK